jgi:hypothetical protein
MTYLQALQSTTSYPVKEFTTRRLLLDRGLNPDEIYAGSGIVGYDLGSTTLLFGNDVNITATIQNGGGTNVITVPSLAGKSFKLNRQGIGDLQGNEYVILLTGGFKLASKDASGNVVTDDAPGAIAQLTDVGERFTASPFIELDNTTYGAATADKKKAFELAKADLYKELIAAANITEGGFSVSMTEKATLKDLANAIYSKYGEPLIAQPTIKGVWAW